MGFKARSEYKGLLKTLGNVETINLMISKEKFILRAISTEKKKEDSPMTKEETHKFLKSLGISQKTIDESKTILVQLDMNTQICYIQQVKDDGTQKFIEI